MKVRKWGSFLPALAVVTLALLTVAPVAMAVITPDATPAGRVAVGSNFAPRFTYADIDGVTGSYFLSATATFNVINRIEKRDSSGTRVWMRGQGAGIGGDENEMLISGLAVDDSAGLVYVSGKNRVAVFDATTGNFVRLWGYGVSSGANVFEVCTASCKNGISGSGAGQFGTSGNGIAVDAAGNVLVPTTHGAAGVSKVMKFTSTGTLLAEYTLTPNVPVSYGRASRDITVDAAGNMVLLWADGFVYRFNSSGAFIDRLGMAYGPGYITPYRPLSTGPNGIAIDPSDGHIFVGASMNNRATEFDSSGAFVQVFGYGVDPATPLGFGACSVACKNGTFADKPGGLRAAQDVIVGSAGRIGVFTHASYRDKLQWFTR